jgi:hypothetical protein
MNKYSMVVDPIRAKNFAVVIQKSYGLSFIPLNEMAKTWASRQNQSTDIKSIKVPDGMYLSSPQNLSRAQQIMLEESVEKTGEAIIPQRIYAGRKSFGKSQNSTSIVGRQIRKIPKNIKLKTVNYKATAFKNRLRRSSTISAVKSHGLSIEEKTCRFRDISNNGLEIIEKSAGETTSRRVAASYFIKELSGNRLSRRAKTLTMKDDELLHGKTCVKSIEIAISAKASRFVW